MNRGRFQILCIIFCHFCACLFFIGTSSFSQQTLLPWQRLQADPFIVFFQDNYQIYAQELMKTLQSAYPKLSQEIGYESKTPIGVFLSHSEKLYNHFVGNNFPKWSEGIALPTDKIMVIKITSTGSDPRKTAIHELTHILLNAAVQEKPIPRWFNEGLAVYYSGEKEFASSSLISKALITNSLIPLSEIDEVMTFDLNKAQLAYQQSYMGVIFILETHGIEGIKKLIQALAREENADQAFLAAIGMDLWDFELAWLDYIRKKHRWHFLVDLDLYLWLLMLGLFITGFFVIRRRNRKLLMQWEQEEQTDDLKNDTKISI